jgi:purine-binding chemotaxis protein CheW
MATSAPTEVVAPAASGGQAHHLTFSLGAELFALDIRVVREIIQIGPMTPVPLMPGFVRGVINLRGAVVPVIDPQARFGRPRAELGRKSCIVVFEGSLQTGERVHLGLLVDAVSAVVDIPADRIEDAPTFGATVRRDYMRGLAKLGSRFVVILEPGKAFDIQDMAGQCEAAQLEAA